MLLSIDRLLLLLSEGKTTEKIAEQAGCEVQEVVSLLQEARKIIRLAKPEYARKKVRLKQKKIINSDSEKRIIDSELLQHAELTVIPLEQPVMIYIAVQPENEGHRYALQLLDKDGNQFGRIVEFSVLHHVDEVWIRAALHAIRVANLFNASVITLRFDRERLADILAGRAALADRINEPAEILSGLVESSNVRMELIDRSANEKVYHLLSLK